MEKKTLLSTHPPKYQSVNTGDSTTTQSVTVKNISVGESHTTEKLSSDDILNFTGFGPFQFIAFLLASFMYFSYALDSAVFDFLRNSVINEFENVTSTQYTVLPAVTGASNVFGAIFWSYSTDRFGRVWPYAFCLIWIGIGSVASAFVNSFTLLIVLRLITSFGIGGVSGLTFPTLVEFLPIRNRGKISVLVLLTGSIGLAASSGLAWWLIGIRSDDPWGWRYFVMASGAPMVLIGVFRLVFHFESPRYLLIRGKTQRAWKVFRSIATFNFKTLTNFISFEDFQKLAESNTVDTKKKMIFVQLLEIFKPRYLRRTLPMTIVVITESFGFLSSQLFLPVFVQNLGVNQYFVMLISAVAQIPGVLLMSIIIEWPKIGRLNSLRMFSLLSASFFALFAGIQTEVSIPVLVVFIYFSAYPILSLSYTYISEVYPTQIRSVTTAYFYCLQALSYLVGAFISNAASNVQMHWLFPAMWSIVYLIQFVAGLIMNYEPLNRELLDVV